MFDADQYTADDQQPTDEDDEEDISEQPDRYTGSEASEGVDEALAAFLNED
jgi:hypothetical protein